MLVNESRAGKTIEKRVKFRIVYAVLLCVLGIASLCIGIFVPLESGNMDFSAGFYVGVGSGLVSASVITIIKNIRLLKNAEALKKRDIYESDERNRLIGLKTWSYTGYAMFIILYITLLIAGAVNVVVMKTILAVLGVYALCLLVTRKIIEKTL